MTTGNLKTDDDFKLGLIDMETIQLNIGGVVLDYILNEDYTIFILPHKIDGTGNYFASVYKRVVVNYKKKDSTDICEGNKECKGKLEFVRFLEKYGRFENTKENNS